MPQIDDTTINPGALWDLIMKLVDPRDLMQTVLNAAAARQDGPCLPGISVAGPHTLLVLGGNVTINHAPAVAPPAPCA